MYFSQWCFLIRLPTPKHKEIGVPNLVQYFFPKTGLQEFSTSEMLQCNFYAGQCRHKTEYSGLYALQVMLQTNLYDRLQVMPISPFKRVHQNNKNTEIHSQSASDHNQKPYSDLKYIIKVAQNVLCLSGVTKC